MAAQTYQQLNNGTRIPAIGFGSAADGTDQYEKISTALRVGYRSIDTAEVLVLPPLLPAVGNQQKRPVAMSAGDDG
jgi:hypothetical protein